MNLKNGSGKTEGEIILGSFFKMGCKSILSVFYPLTLPLPYLVR
jgi:hypothetical protein